MEGVEVSRDCHAIILAGGVSERFDAGVPKQFYEVNGKTIVYHTVQKFVRLEFISTIVVAAPPDERWLSRMHAVLKPLSSLKQLEITAGGKTRHRSVVEGLKCLCKLLQKSGKNWRKDIVVIHDAARPFVTVGDIFSAASCAKDYKGAGIFVPIRGTATELDANKFLLKCYDRSSHWSSEAPQAFQLGFIRECYEKCSEYDMDYLTDCMQIALKYGDQPLIKFSKGDPCNLKVTYLTDLMPPSMLLNECEGMLLILPESTNNSNSLPSESYHLSSNLPLMKSISGDCDIPSCSLGKLAERLDHISAVVYSIAAGFGQLLVEAERVLQVLQCSNSKSFHQLKAILFVVLDSGGASEQGNFRKMLFAASEKFLERNLVCHAIVTNDYRSVIGRLKTAMTALTDASLLPSGQILYF